MSNNSNGPKTGVSVQMVQLQKTDETEKSKAMLTDSRVMDRSKYINSCSRWKLIKYIKDSFGGHAYKCLLLLYRKPSMT